MFPNKSTGNRNTSSSNNSSTPKNKGNSQQTSYNKRQNGSTASQLENSKSSIHVIESGANSRPENVRNQLYKVKCVKLEKKLKEVVFLNAALESEVDETRDKLADAREERRFLLNRLLSYQKEAHRPDGNNKILQTALSKKPQKPDKFQSSVPHLQPPNFNTPIASINSGKRKRSTNDVSIVAPPQQASFPALNSSLNILNSGTSTKVKLDPCPKGLSQLLVDCNSGASSSFLLE